jgi:phosphoribosyl-ATP pyrophosphohydrolase/phosphoribosyl-AMP cyclohydrolase
LTTTGLDFLSTLEDVIRQRLGDPQPESYTAQLVAQGGQRVAQKVGEEAVELALAAVGGDRAAMLNEAADLLYHVLVLLNSRDASLAEIVAILESRHKR